MSDSILPGISLRRKYRRARDVTVSSMSFWGPVKSDFCVLFIFVGN